jgi:TRAP-type C4-dicarboxylate transport system permease small subunit
MRLLDALARFSAVLAGLLLVGIALLTVSSVVGRTVFEHAITGDFELVAFAAGAAVALFLPWCQLRRANIIVDFFTTRSSMRARRRMDRIGSLIMAAVMALLAWRTALGGLSAWRTGSGSMMMGFPEWVIYAFMVPAIALSALIALHQAIFDSADAPGVVDTPSPTSSHQAVPTETLSTTHAPTPSGKPARSDTPDSSQRPAHARHPS